MRDVPQSRSEVVETVREHHDCENHVKIEDVEDSGLRSYDIYRFFDGVEELECAVRGEGSIDYVCEKCGREFDSREKYHSHKGAVSHDRQRRLERARETLAGFENGCISYTITVERCDGKRFAYVGSSASPVSRLADHMSSRTKIWMPEPSEDRITNTQHYDFVELVSFETFEDIAEAKEAERRRYLEYAIENETTDVLGGT